MSVAIVHFLELVQIEDYDGQTLTVAFRAIQLLIAIFVEKPPVIETG